MNITIFGAGNLGLSCSLVLGKQNNVTLFTHKPHQPVEAIAGEYEGVEQTPVEIAITDNLATACEADLILCTYPAFLRKQFLEDVAPHLKPGTLLGFIPGYGGIELSCREVIERGVTVFGFQRVPYVSRSNWNERRAGILSAKSTLYVAALPKDKTEQVAQLIEDLFHIPTVALKEYLAVTLAPSNPLLHTCGAYGVFKEYEAGDTFDSPLKFYEHWTDETSELLFAFDQELQDICQALAPLDLSEVVSLRTYYESPTPSDLTKKLQSIEAFKAVMVPLSEIDGGKFVPNWNDRMFIEDYPFGVAIIKDIALMANIDTPAIDTLLSFYQRCCGITYFQEDGSPSEAAQSSGIPRCAGFDTIESLINFYQN